MHFIVKVSLSVSAASQSKLGALDLGVQYCVAVGVDLNGFHSR